MVILHQHNGILRACLVAHRFGEASIDAYVLLPVGGTEYRAHMRDMAERPQAFVGEAGVVALFLLFRQPHATQRIARLIGRHAQPIVPIHGLAVGAAAAMSDPGARAGAHHRLQRGDEPTCGTLQDHAVAVTHMDEWLAIGYHEDFVAQQLLAQDVAQ